MFLQVLRSSFSIFIAQILSFLTDPLVLLVIISLSYWAWDKDKALFLFLILLTSSFTASLLKIIFHIPRPFSDSPRNWAVTPQEQENLLITYSFPSQRTLIYSAYYSFYGFKLQTKKIVYTGAIILLMLIISRLVLGVNYLEDLLTGAFIGIALGFIFWYVDLDTLYSQVLSEDSFEDAVSHQGLTTEELLEHLSSPVGDDEDEYEDDNETWQSNFHAFTLGTWESIVIWLKQPFHVITVLAMLAYFIYCLLLFVLHPITTLPFAFPLGLFAGLSLGSFLENKYIMFPSKPPGIIETIVRMFIGLVVFFGVYLFFQLAILGLFGSLLSPLSVLLLSLQFFLLGLSITVFVPFLITKIEVD